MSGCFRGGGDCKEESDLLGRVVVGPLHVSDEVVPPGAGVRTRGTFERSHPLMNPPVKGKSEGGVESFATFLTGVSHVSSVASHTVVKPAPEPVTFTTNRAGVQLLPCSNKYY